MKYQENLHVYRVFGGQMNGPENELKFILMFVNLDPIEWERTDKTDSLPIPNFDIEWTEITEQDINEKLYIWTIMISR